MLSYWELMRWGDQGWADEMAYGALLTLAVSAQAFVLGLCFGTLAAFAKLSSSRAARAVADGYTTVLRGIPDLLVIYLLYFGGSGVVTSIAEALGHDGFVEINPFFTGALAVGIVSGAYSTEVIRGAYLAIARGEIEAAKSVGMSPFLMFRRILAPQILRYALPGLGNVWQLALKESALISVTGLVEILRQSVVGSGSTKQPFDFYMTAALAFLVLTTVTGWLFRRAEAWSMRGVRRD
ncbi:MAG: ABC transporter permease [Alphaproteobacteria bacterium]|nr:ABC transporter permease [Alphaproteobacteria bacterium]